MIKKNPPPRAEKVSCASIHEAMAKKGAITTEERFKACLEASAAFVKSDAKATERRNKMLVRAYELFVAAVAQSEERKLRKLLQKEGIKGKESTHLLVLLLRWSIGAPDVRSRASRWASALRFALSKNVKPRRLIDFLRSENGIEKCAKQFVDLARASEETDIEHDAIDTKATADSRIKIEREARLVFERMRKHEKKIKVNMTGHLRNEGDLVIDSICRADKE